ncbi:hypothetical protein PP740_gp019 [Stenotrophomonas phage Philippe]|uniref:Uncharacterized protein n=1 Tax=Stenotrophomonas phage Philippe TaxID=2859655 RepID=A0AAE8BLN8_9CAUD|nr:hypothetical protein PP740_gp019 [Stenotrophomonas phage Philippe]QYW02218.1 hypothetical protein CPT_Philippe_019 [Stenotrophomonas phage Philippe]
MSKPIFVFGSNTHGIHGAGAAAAAYKSHGARWGMGFGHYGDSFAIPTKGAVQAADGHTTRWVVGKTLTMGRITDYVNGFLAYAEAHPELTFHVTRIGCGLAGLKDADVAELFVGAPDNCLFDQKWAAYLHSTANFWGTF